MNTARRVFRVVLAEDEALPAELLRRSLTRLGHSVVGIARDGAEAVALVRALGPDVVIMDLRMPQVDGWTAMAELARVRPLPVIVVSALDDREALEQAAFAGASAFLLKPVREDELERALELAVARFGELQELRQWRAEAEQRAQEEAAQAAELQRLLRELRETRLQLVSAARRATAASLARGMTHEINNALTPIIAAAQMIALQYPDDALIARRTNEIVEQAKMIAGWTASFQQVAGSGKGTVIPFSFNETIRQACELYTEHFRRHSVTLLLELDEDLPLVRGHPEQIQEALMSVIQNAVEAMRGGGELEIRSFRNAAGDSIHGSIADTGEGITPECLPHVFEPGFTTKGSEGTASGLGWGLFTARQIICAHGGDIRIASPGPGRARGTLVDLMLPAAP